jgi:ell wall binding domain 2 (CWB2)
MYFSKRVAADRPINADVPEPEEPAEPVPSAEEPPKPPAPATPLPSSPDSGDKSPGVRSGRPRVPGALVLIGGLVLLAIGFIVLAIVAGSGGGPDSETSASGPAPAPVQAEAEPADEGEAQTPAAQTSERLGYPAFATDNTTRVGGSSPAENAAAAALAVFPSTTPEQRPAAVTLVDEEDWPAAIAAAVLMAPPVRAPMLLSSPEDAPEATEEALAALDPHGSKETSGAHGFAFGEVAIPDSVSGIETIRPAGAGTGEGEDQAATAAAIAELRDRLVGSPPDAILVAPLEGPGFAAPAAAWAARSGDPVLFAEQKALPKPTEEALGSHAKVPVYVLGPSAAIADSVLGAIKKLGNPVQRVAGHDPVANAIAFARYGDGGFGWNVNDPGHGFVLARDDSPLDAAAAAPLSAAGTWGPLLLTDDAGTLPPEVRGYFLDVKPGYTTNPTRAYYNHVWVIGDQEAIDVKQQAEVNELAELAKIGEG